MANNGGKSVSKQYQSAYRNGGVSEMARWRFSEMAASAQAMAKTAGSK